MLKRYLGIMRPDSNSWWAVNGLLADRRKRAMLKKSNDEDVPNLGVIHGPAG